MIKINTKSTLQMATRWAFTGASEYHMESNEAAVGRRKQNQQIKLGADDCFERRQADDTKKQNERQAQFDEIHKIGDEVGDLARQRQGKSERRRIKPGGIGKKRRAHPAERVERRQVKGPAPLEDATQVPGRPYPIVVAVHPPEVAGQAPEADRVDNEEDDRRYEVKQAPVGDVTRPATSARGMLRPIAASAAGCITRREIHAVVVQIF